MPSTKPRKADGSPGVFDVSKPGKTTPDATAKPIIVTNRPILQDPMVVEGDGSDAPSPAAARITIQPITVTTPDDDQEQPVKVSSAKEETTVSTNSPQSEDPVDAVDSKPAAAAAEQVTETEKQHEPETNVIDAEQPSEETDAVAVKTADKTDDKAKKPEESEAAASTEKASPPEKETDQPAEDQPDKKDAKEPVKSPAEQDAEAKKAAEEAAAHTAAIQKLAESEQYFLPINSVEKHKTRQFILLGLLLIVVLGAAWADIALDAGLVHIHGLKAATHFFTN